MKKLKKVLAVLALAALAASFTACFIPTEEELLQREVNGGNDGGNGGGGGSNTIGNAWGALFSDHNHNPIDLQVWQNFTASYDVTNGMKCTIGGSQWFGGAIVQNNKPAPADSIYYDMSKVRRMTFKVKASQNMTIWAGYSNANKTDALIKTTVAVTTDWQTVEIVSNGVSQAWAIFALGSDGGYPKDSWLAIKDVTYFDASNNNVTLKYAE